MTGRPRAGLSEGMSAGAIRRFFFAFADPVELV
jgi:hypothetical protein